MTAHYKISRRFRRKEKKGQEKTKLSFEHFFGNSVELKPLPIHFLKQLPNFSVQGVVRK